MRRLPKGFLKCTIPVTPNRPSLASAGKDLHMTLRREGCTNRPFFHIVVTKTTYPIRAYIDPLEQVGTYDPLINKHGEKLCALNIERILFYISQGIELDRPVAQLLGLAGLLPQHPSTYKMAWRNRREFTREEMRRQLEPETEEHPNIEGVPGTKRGTGELGIRQMRKELGNWKPI